MDRATLLEQLVGLIVSVEKSHPVPIDAVDAAGEDNFGRRARRSCGATRKTRGSASIDRFTVPERSVIDEDKNRLRVNTMTLLTTTPSGTRS